MERHECKLCLKRFGNGRALGGHMRSHMFNLPVAPKPEDPERGPPVQLSEETDSASSEEGEGGEEKEQCYGLRENPKRSIRLVDPEFSFAVDAGSVVLQDRESETESSKNPTRRRSKRIRKPDHQHHNHNQRREQDKMKKLIKFNNNQPTKTESWPEPEPASSISDATTEEDVAFCLMMLSKDKWKKKEEEFEEFEDMEKYSVDETDDDSEDFKLSKNRSRGKYKCETCNKVFKSYQALGGHRASHKKIRVHSPTRPPELDPENVGASSASGKKIHECPVCFRVFSSGQALGGHKRSHMIGGAVETIAARSCTKLGDSLIDLNLPAPAEEDDFSQIELSALSDAELSTKPVAEF